MSLYGLDVLIERDTGKYHINEINGITSGMHGFREIYGDNRIEKRVYDQLKQKYGKLAVYIGEQAHDDQSLFSLALDLFELLFQSKQQKLQKNLALLSSSHAYNAWFLDQPETHIAVSFPFPIYKNEKNDDAVLINVTNENLPRPFVNPYIAQELTRNKFLQWWALKDSAMKEYIIPSALIGLGATDEQQLTTLLETETAFVTKPLRGSKGMGVQFLTKKEAEHHNQTRGPIEDFTMFVHNKKSRLTYVEDYVDACDFSFEYGLGILQAFIDSRRLIDGQEQYSVIRAIVCNGKFVDAYSRVSPDSRVNLCRGAKPYTFEQEGFDAFCEHIVAVFESEAQKYDPQTFKQQLYHAYFDSRGRTTAEQRQQDLYQYLFYLQEMRSTVESGR